MALAWTSRLPREELLTHISNSDHRVRDLYILTFPDLQGKALTTEELDQQSIAVAVLNVRDAIEYAAMISIVQTTLVLIIILGGIYALTHDLTFLSRNLLRPLVELADEMESITRLQLAGVTTDDKDLDQGSSEIRLIRRSFGNMKTAIRSWGKYVPWPVVQILLRKDAQANLEVTDKEVSMFFSDIAGFTTIVESLPPERSLLLLSRYFHDMSKIIDAYEGIVIEYIGDAIMSIHGAPISNPDHPILAVKSALRMLSALKTMNRWFAEHNLPTVSIRAGVHTGSVLVGNMGFESRMKYGVVGEDANVPGRLEELNKNYSSELLISQATHDRLPKNLFVTRPIDFVYLISGAKSQLVYQVLERNKSDEALATLQDPCALHAKAMKLYRAREFAKSAEEFGKVNQLMKRVTGADDVPSTLLEGRCRSYLERPPARDWDGVWDRTG